MWFIHYQIIRAFHVYHFNLSQFCSLSESSVCIISQNVRCDWEARVLREPTAATPQRNRAQNRMLAFGYSVALPLLHNFNFSPVFKSKQKRYELNNRGHHQNYSNSVIKNLITNLFPRTRLVCTVQELVRVLKSAESLLYILYATITASLVSFAFTQVLIFLHSVLINILYTNKSLNNNFNKSIIIVQK